jgi:hypothetical protein
MLAFVHAPDFFIYKYVNIRENNLSDITKPEIPLETEIIL